MTRRCDLGYVLCTHDGRAVWVGARPGTPSGLAPLSAPLPRAPPVYPDRPAAQAVARALLAARRLPLVPVRCRSP